VLKLQLSVYTHANDVRFIIDAAKTVDLVFDLHNLSIRECSVFVFVNNYWF